MIIAVLSGKGGTGKTTVALNLARSFGTPVQLLDCDVEEPNAHLFLPGEVRRTESVSVPVPKVDEAKCDACGKCSEICQFNAIISLKTKPLVFSELCHSCGGCALVCPQKAISEVPKFIGLIETISLNLPYSRAPECWGCHVSSPYKRSKTSSASKHAGNPGCSTWDIMPCNYHGKRR